MRHFAHKLCSGFRNDRDGTIGVETMLVLILLIWAYVATFTYFDAFRTQNSAAKANFVISDMLSRQGAPIDADYLDGLGKTFDYLLAGQGTNGWIRVTSLELNDEGTAHVVQWSYGTKGHGGHSDGTIAAEWDRIPVMAIGDSAILVESSISWVPFVDFVGLTDRKFQNFVVTRPRFTPRLVFDNGGA